jgi:hypothetical protein
MATIHSMHQCLRCGSAVLRAWQVREPLCFLSVSSSYCHWHGTLTRILAEKVGASGLR